MKSFFALLLLAFAFVPSAPRAEALSDSPVVDVAGGPKQPQHLKIFRTPDRRASVA
jgi:hypothetical protein